MSKELASRPLVIAFLGLVAGLASGFEPSNVFFVLVLAPVLKGLRQWSILAAAVLAGLLLRVHPEPLVKVQGGTYRGPAVVLNCPATERDSIVMVVQAKDKRYRLRMPEDSNLNLGDKIEIDAKIVPLSEHAVSQRLEVAELRAQHPVRVVEPGFVGWKWGMSLRRGFLTFVEAHVDKRVVGMVEALTLNVSGDLPSTMVDSLKRSGTIHVISASGLHVTIIAFALAWLLLALPVPRWAQLVALSACLFFYGAAAGFHPPMFRAIVMVETLSFAYLFFREADTLSALALSGVLTMLLEPESVATIGFQLSYVAVAALLMFGPRDWPARQVTVVRRIGDWLMAAIKTSVVATLATAPLLAYSFGLVPLVTPVSNLLVVPVVPVVVITSLAGWAASLLWPGLGVGLLKVVVEPLVAWMGTAVETLANQSWAAVEVPKFSPYWLIAVYVCYAALYRFQKRQAED